MKKKRQSMGCGQSKIEQEETVARCKDRKRFMHEAVVARNRLAAAHSAYAASLKDTGAALSDYAQGEWAISDHIPRPHRDSANSNVNSHVMSLPQRSSSASLVEVSRNKGKAPMDMSIREEEEDADESVPRRVILYDSGVMETGEYLFQDTMPPLTLFSRGQNYEYPYKPVLELYKLTL